MLPRNCLHWGTRGVRQAVDLPGMSTGQDMWIAPDMTTDSEGEVGLTVGGRATAVRLQGTLTDSVQAACQDTSRQADH